MRKQGHTQTWALHYYDYQASMRSFKQADWAWLHTLFLCIAGTCVCVCVCVPECFKKRCALRKKEQKEKTICKSSSSTNFSVETKESTLKWIHVLLPTVCPQAACLSKCVCVCVCEGKQKEKRCVCYVCLYANPHCGHVSAPGTKSVGPRCWRGNGGEGWRDGGSGGVYSQDDTAVTLPGLLSIPLTWEHKQSTKCYVGLSNTDLR